MSHVITGRLCLNEASPVVNLKCILIVTVMKPSSSTTSLTALTEVVSEIDCFICLEPGPNELGEPLVDSSLLRKCGCKFKVHPLCWNKWMKGKTEFDCPICRQDSLNIHVVPVPLPPDLRVRDLNGILLCSLLVVVVFVGISVMIALNGRSK